MVGLGLEKAQTHPGPSATTRLRAPCNRLTVVVKLAESTPARLPTVGADATAILDVQNASKITMWSYERRPRPHWVGWFLPALVPGLFLWGMTRVRHDVESTLEAKATRALAIVGANDVKVSVDGRDVTLTGVLPNGTSLATARHAVEAVNGVRAVSDSAIVDTGATTNQAKAIVVETTTATTAQTPSVTVTTVTTSLPTTSLPTTSLPTAPAQTTGPAPSTTAPPPETLGDLSHLPTVEFEFGRADLTPTGAALVDAVAAVLAKNPNTFVRIEGHTDIEGTPAANQVLSENRANNVRSVLIAKGVAANHLTAVGFGSSRPLSTNATDAGRQKNRRIEFIVLN